VKVDITRQVEAARRRSGDSRAQDDDRHRGPAEPSVSRAAEVCGREPR
jgi:hypothetical protein